jgi:hypothetical protein
MLQRRVVTGKVRVVVELPLPATRVPAIVFESYRLCRRA